MTTGTISKETAEAIWAAHRELEVARKLKAELQEKAQWRDDPRPEDAYGRRHDYQLGVPSGENSHRLYRVPASLMPYCLDLHIAAQEKQLAEACVAARMELDGISGAPEVSRALRAVE